METLIHTKLTTVPRIATVQKPSCSKMNPHVRRLKVAMKHSNGSWDYTDTKLCENLITRGTETNTFYGYCRNNPGEFNNEQRWWLSIKRLGDWDPPPEYYDPRQYDEFVNQHLSLKKRQCRKEVIRQFCSVAWGRQQFNRFDGRLLQHPGMETTFECLVACDNIYLELAKRYIEYGYETYYAGREFEELRGAQRKLARMSELEKLCKELDAKYQEALKFQNSLQEKRTEEQL